MTPDQEKYLATLSELGGSAGNHKLQDRLGWALPLYDSVKQSLLSFKKITLGRGRGGSVSLATVYKPQIEKPSPEPSEGFVETEEPEIVVPKNLAKWPTTSTSYPEANDYAERSSSHNRWAYVKQDGERVYVTSLIRDVGKVVAVFHDGKQV